MSLGTALLTWIFKKEKVRIENAKLRRKEEY